MKKTLSLLSSLTLICAICAAVLAYVNGITKEPIREILARRTLEAAKAVMPCAVTEVAELELSSGEKAYLGKDAAGAIVGYAVSGTDGGGYGGDITLMVGFEADRKTVVSYRTLAASETPGLGMKLSTPEFSGQFAGRAAASLAVKKDGGEIEAITSATITSRAVCRAIAAAAAKLTDLK